MPEAENSFAVMPDLARRMPRIQRRWAWWWRIVYALRAAWRRLRVSHACTALMGPQYRRSRDMIEIDITYACNLHCLNCNRSVTQAREAMHMPLEMVTQFVDQSLATGRAWRRIRVLGGEPTMHPRFTDVMAELLRYRAAHPTCIVEVVTNGHGEHVNARLRELPPEVMIDNSAKEGPVQPHFGPFNLAPVDDAHWRGADFRNGCAVLRDCGMGLTPMGYYPCAVAGGIDRIVGEGLAAPSLPPDADDMLAACDRLCRLCGRFQTGHYVPKILRPPLTTEQVSPTWREAYARWHARRRGAPSGPASQALPSKGARNP